VRSAIVLRAAASLSLVVASAFLTGRALACSQCMCGNPFPTDVLGVSQSFSARFGVEDRYLSKSNALDDEPGNESEQSHRLAPFALFRPSPKFMVIGKLPYVFKQVTETPTGEESRITNTRGLGDAEVMSFLEAFDGGRSGAFSVIAGGTAPTGSNNQTDDMGQRLDAHAQPGTGAWSGTAGADYNVATRAGRLDLNASARWSGTSAHGYHYGNTALYNAGLTHRFGGNWQGMLQLNGRTAQRDQLEGGGIGENTGGTVLYVAPGARWLGFAGVAIEAAVQIPVVESLYGVQDEHATARFALSYAP
jgi:hypothetical protein